jgi:hypothetical protein
LKSPSACGCATARGLFGGEGALGRRIARAEAGRAEWGEIVGIAGDVQSVASDRLAAPFQVYTPMAQEPLRSSEIAVRTAGAAPAALVESIRTTMMALAPDLPVRQLQPAADSIRRRGKYQSIISRLLSVLPCSASAWPPWASTA